MVHSLLMAVFLLLKCSLNERPTGHPAQFSTTSLLVLSVGMPLLHPDSAHQSMTDRLLNVEQDFVMMNRQCVSGS